MVGVGDAIVEQAMHELLAFVRIAVGDEGVDFIWVRQQADEIEADAPEERGVARAAAAA